MSSKKNIVILSGAGISAESGIKTFRDSNGLWENHDIMEVASPQGWNKDPALVLNFYNLRRKQLKEVEPNAGHISLVRLEEKYNVTTITQNVDNLHERAGATNVIHLHGELTKVRSTKDESIIIETNDDIKIGDKCPLGSQLRPHIVWFGEMVPLLEVATEVVCKADILIIIGTSMQVYPAASLFEYAPPHAKIYYIDPNPAAIPSSRIRTIAEKGSIALPMLVDELINNRI